MRLLSSLLLLAGAALAGPVEFGQAELDAAMVQRNLKWKNQAELSLDAPDTFRIEPYAAGGAHITGGDLRGLMYGLLEAAEQIRATGRFAKAGGSPAASLRGVRIVLNAELERAPEEFWNAYFRMLARNRFNRVHVVFERMEAPYRLPQFLSRAAADYGIDFTLGVAGGITALELARVLLVCPAIRAVAAEGGGAQEAVFSALRVAGRRVALDPDGAAAGLGVSTGGAAITAMATPASGGTTADLAATVELGKTRGGGATAEPELIQEALASGVPVLRPAAAWPPSFEVSPAIDAAKPEAHEVFYQVMGRLSYDPKSKPPAVADATTARAAREVALWMAAAQQSDGGGSEYVASAREALRNRAEHIASAKFTPDQIAERLDLAAAQLEPAALPDLRYLAALGRAQAAQQRRGALLPEVRNAARPLAAWTHTPVESAPSEQPLTLVLHLNQVKAVSAVRLHYRAGGPAAERQSIEMPSGAVVNFTIPAKEITGNWDMQYYFEILSADGTGWFEPDPLNGAPYWVVHIIAPHTGRK